MRISLIICTRNRARQLEACLEHVQRLEAPPGGWQAVIVDNGSTETTPDVIRAFASSTPCEVIQVYEGRGGLSRARNAGVAHATGDICAFTDDDCYVRPDFLTQTCAALEDPRTGYMGGRVILHDPTDAPVATKDSTSVEPLLPRSFLPTGVIHGANMAVRRQVLHDIGGFDPLLGAGTPLHSAEDTDFLARACWAGWPGIYDPRPVVAHHHGRKPGPDVDRLQSGYDYGRGAYYLKRALNQESRIIYLREWYWSIRNALARRAPGGAFRELIGAGRYLALRLRSREPIPRF